MAKAKAKTVFFCKECGYESAKWMGQCPGCHQWNTLVEERVTPTARGTASRTAPRQKLTGLFEVSMEEEERKARQKGWKRAVRAALAWARDEEG